MQNVQIILKNSKNCSDMFGKFCPLGTIEHYMTSTTVSSRVLPLKNVAIDLIFVHLAHAFHG